MQQTHRFLADRMGYYSNCYSTIAYIISCFFCVHITMLPPLIIKKNAMAALSSSLYITDLAAPMGELSLNVTTKWVTRYSNLIEEPHLLTVYVTTPPSTRSAEYQRRRYVMGDADWILEVTSSSGDYGKSRMTPSSASYLETWTQTPTGSNQRKILWIDGRGKINIKR